jgi:hypothetical protein
MNGTIQSLNPRFNQTISTGRNRQSLFLQLANVVPAKRQVMDEIASAQFMRS